MTIWAAILALKTRNRFAFLYENLQQHNFTELFLKHQTVRVNKITDEEQRLSLNQLHLQCHIFLLMMTFMLIWSQTSPCCLLTSIIMLYCILFEAAGSSTGCVGKGLWCKTTENVHASFLVVAFTAEVSSQKKSK